MPGVVMQALAALKPARDRRHEGFDRLERVGDRRLLAEQLRIDADQDLGRLIGGAPDHDPVEMLKLGARGSEILDAAVEDDRPAGMGAFQRTDERIVERRDRPVVFRAQAVEPGFARMDDERRRARRLHRFGEGAERLSRLLLIDADATFHGHRNVDRRGHRRDAVGDQPRLAHQAGPEPAALHPVGRAAAIEIDFVIAELGPDPRRLGEPRRVGAAELERNRMLGSVEADQTLARPEHDRVRRHHLGVEPRPAREQAMERPAAPIGPVHHRGNGESKHLIWLHFPLISTHQQGRAHSFLRHHATLCAAVRPVHMERPRLGDVHEAEFRFLASSGAADRKICQRDVPSPEGRSHSCTARKRVESSAEVTRLAPKIR